MSIDYDQAIMNLLNIFNAFTSNNNQDIQMAEKQLQNFSRDTFYPLYLLKLILVNDSSVHDFNKTRAAIEFKKWALSDWVSLSSGFNYVRPSQMFKISNFLNFILRLKKSYSRYISPLIPRMLAYSWKLF